MHEMHVGEGACLLKLEGLLGHSRAKQVSQVNEDSDIPEQTGCPSKAQHPPHLPSLSWPQLHHPGSLGLLLPLSRGLAVPKPPSPSQLCLCWVGIDQTDRQERKISCLSPLK